MFAIAIVARLHKLDHAAVQILPGGAHHQAERARGFALAVTGVDHEQAARLFLIIFTTPFVFLFFGRHEVRTACGSGLLNWAVQESWWLDQPPATAGGSDSLIKVRQVIALAVNYVNGARYAFFIPYVSLAALFGPRTPCAFPV